MKRVIATALASTVLSLASGCKKDPPPEAAKAETTSVDRPAPQSTAAPAAPIAAGAQAEIAKPAPDFTLKDLDGKEHRLSELKGKVVVLEWFNPGCPFVNRSHVKGSLKDAAKRHTKDGVVWLGINSGASGKQGYGVDANRAGAKKLGIDHPILLDESGEVGKAYGATNTPHMFVVDPQGTLVYRGAIDNSPDGEGESAPDGKLVSYVDEALAAIAAGKPVATPSTKAYGCGVKYAR
jgi:peroxiredoxin